MSRSCGRSLVRKETKCVVNLALLLLLMIECDSSKAVADMIFSEGSGPVPYALEEEILEELARGHELKAEDKPAGIPYAAKAEPKTNDVFNVPPIPYNVKEPQPRPQPKPTPVPSISSVDSEPANRPAPSPAPTSNAKQQYDELKSAAAAAIMKQTAMLQNQQNPAKYKKDGQIEFPTFVEPFPQPSQNRRLNAEKFSYNGHVGHEEKRVPANVGKPGDSDDLGDTVFVAVVAVCSVVGVIGFSVAGYTFYSLHKQHKAAQEVEYPHYGVTGPAKERTSGTTSPVAAMDAKLASSAQLYHYQHTKQQIIAMENSTSDAKGQDSEDSEGEGEEGDFSVYECPGLAPTGDIEVSNPLFENVGAPSPHGKVDPRQPTGDATEERSPVQREEP